MATISPPADTTRQSVPPREMVFVIDNSGSMGGASMEEAKASLVHALKTLRPQDWFNVIRFDDTMTQLFDHSVRATPEQVATAIHFAEGLKANGGTEMLPALQAALADASSSGDAETLRQIIFLTDGAISNEQEMMALISKDGGRTRIFPVAIGSAPNDFLMSRMASIGRGTYTHVSTPEEVSGKMTLLLNSLQRPSASNLTVTVNGTALDLTPRILPDLYFGEPLVVLGQTRSLQGTMTISGTIGGRPWSQTLDLAQAEPSPAVAKLWARRRIDDVEADRWLGKLTQGAADDAIGELGLAHSIVTSQTSLVAVDETAARGKNVPLTREDLPINLPDGWSFDTLFGGEAGAAAMANAKAQGAHMANQQDAGAVLELPKTATNFMATILGGLALMLAGGFGLFLLRTRKEIVK
jgi:Ca-activated chloride channel family protein